MSQKQIILHIICILFGVFFVPLYFWYWASLSVSPNGQQILQCWSSHDFIISLNTSWENVVASDIKFFIQWFTWSGFVSLSWFNHVDYLGTGISTKWQNVGKTYHYINVYQNSFSNPKTGNAIPIAKITLMPISGASNWSITFYNLSANDEDSNIAVGIEHGTEWFPIRYNDFLTNTIDGSYTFSECLPISTGWTWWWGGWWWGGWSLHKDDCLLPSPLPWANSSGIDYSFGYYDNTCEAGTWHEMPNTCPIGATNFSQEMIDAFQFSYGMNITTMCPVESARLNGYILRKELAKMMTNFTIKVMWIYPDLNKTWCDVYNDMSNESREMQFYTKTICQLSMMWLNEDGIVPKKSFDPNQYVDRAQFGTILSRLIFGGRYNLTGNNFDHTKKDYRFKNHLAALKVNSVMNNISDPYMLELRWYVFIMLQRVYDSWITQKYRLFSSAKNWSTALHNN